MEQELIKLLNNKQLIELLNEQELVLADKVQYGFNVFTVSKRGAELENFHSDILHHLLNPEGPHGEGRVFLDAFLRFLNTLPNSFHADLGDFKNAKVEKELAKLDVSIIDWNSKKAIIVENKINNAPDQVDQLLRYYNWCISRGLDVVGIVYLTLNNLKFAPVAGIPKTIPICNIQAFSNRDANLVEDWITPCVGLCKRNDTNSFLNQYKKLLTYLAYDSMEEKIMPEVYKVLNSGEQIDRVNKLKALSDAIPKYRTDTFVNEIGDVYEPFTKTYRYKDNHMLYEDFLEFENKFKLDVIFESNGSVNIHFWNTNKGGEEAASSINAKINQIGYSQIMTPSIADSEWIRSIRHFSVSEYKTLPEMDNEVVAFVKGIMNALKVDYVKS